MNQNIQNALKGRIAGSYEDKAAVIATSLLENANGTFGALLETAPTP